MLITKKLVGKIVKVARCCSSSTNVKTEILHIQRTTYQTDEWTNINKRFEPFIGANLYRKLNHPLRSTQEQIVAFFQKWFGENVSNCELKLYKNLDPIEPNTSSTKDQTAFYVNRDLVLRTHAINREIKYLKSGSDNFLMIVDLYRRCEMDSKHFPAFHRVNAYRTVNLDHRHSDQSFLETEQKAVLVELVKHLMGLDVKYRCFNVDMASTAPSWVLEVWHQNEWHRIFGGGLIASDIFEKSERPNTAGWEISVGLDRLTMILYNIFDVRLLWNASQSFLKQFEPLIVTNEHQKVPNNESVQSPVAASSTSNHSNVEMNLKFATKATKHEMHISYILPSNTDLESFPSDELCTFIKNNTENAAEQVEIRETFFHPKLETHVINVKVTYKLSHRRTKDAVLNLHNSVRALAAHKFDISLRL